MQTSLMGTMEVGSVEWVDRHTAVKQLRGLSKNRLREVGPVGVKETTWSFISGGQGEQWYTWQIERHGRF